MKMTQQHSKGAMVRFLDAVVKQGLVNTNTASGWKAAATRILEDVQDDQDVRALDLKTAVIRYNNRHPGELSPSSLKEYERRLLVIVSEFTSYVDNPTGYKARGRGLPKGNGEKGDSKGKRASTPPPSIEMPIQAPPTPAPSVKSGLTLEFPMRAEFLAQIVVPRDMTVVEARRLCAFVMTLAADFAPEMK